MTDPLTTLLRETAQRVPTALHPAASLREDAKRHQRVRRAGAGAATATIVAAALVLGGGLPDGQKRATELPATQPDLSQDSLLIADELPVMYTPHPNTWQIEQTIEGKTASPVTSCKPASIESLAPDRVWRRTFTPGQLVSGAQVAAQFASPGQAAKAFDTVDAWFDSCEGLKRQAWRWPAFSAFGGTGRSAAIGLPVPGDDNSTRYENIGYAVNGSMLTVVTVSTADSDQGAPLNQQQPAEAADPMQTAMLFALQRLGGSRDLAANAVPESFTFAEEKEPSLDEPPTEPPSNLGQEWRVISCSFDKPPASREGLALRTGMRAIAHDNVDPEGVHFETLTLQLGVYANSADARAEVEALRGRIAACAAEFGGEQRTLQSTAGPLDVQVAFHGRTEGFNEGGHAVTVVQRGNSVFVVNALASLTANNEDPEVLQDRSVELAVESVEKNIDRICELTGKCS